MPGPCSERASGRLGARSGGARRWWSPSPRSWRAAPARHRHRARADPPPQAPRRLVTPAWPAPFPRACPAPALQRSRARRSLPRHGAAGNRWRSSRRSCRQRSLRCSSGGVTSSTLPTGSFHTLNRCPRASVRGRRRAGARSRARKSRTRWSRIALRSIVKSQELPCSTRGFRVAVAVSSMRGEHVVPR